MYTSAFMNVLVPLKLILIISTVVVELRNRQVLYNRLHRYVFKRTSQNLKHFYEMVQNT